MEDYSELVFTLQLLWPGAPPIEAKFRLGDSVAILQEDGVQPFTLQTYADGTLVLSINPICVNPIKKVT